MWQSGCDCKSLSDWGEGWGILSPSDQNQLNEQRPFDKHFDRLSDRSVTAKRLPPLNLTVAEPVEAPLSLFSGYYAEALRQAQGPLNGQSGST